MKVEEFFKKLEVKEGMFPYERMKTTVKEIQNNDEKEKFKIVLDEELNNLVSCIEKRAIDITEESINGISLENFNSTNKSSDEFTEESNCNSQETNITKASPKHSEELSPTQKNSFLNTEESNVSSQETTSSFFTTPSIKSHKIEQLSSNATENDTLKIRVQDLCDFIIVNVFAFKKILKKYKKITGECLKQKYEVKINSTLEKEVALQKLVKASKNNITKHRTSEKYWIPSSNLVNLKLKILQKLPTTTYVDNAVRLDDSIVSTVYLDNVNLLLYTSYLDKRPGSFIIRLRWYGVDPEIIYCELINVINYLDKDPYTCIKIPKDLVLSFINGTDIWNQLQELNSDIEIYNQISRKILQYRLRPTIRTYFKRIIFSGQDLKVYFDSNVAMIKECVDLEMENDHFPLKQYSRTDIEYNYPFRRLKDNEVKKLSFTVLEIVKESDSLTSSIDYEWVKSVLEEENYENTIDFSKFIHGSALLYPHTGILPKWISHSNKQNVKTNKDVLYIKGESNISHDFSPVSNEEQNNSANVRVEPKTFFANERTFLNWIEFSIYVGGAGTAMVNFDNLNAFYLGVLLIVITIVFSIYSLYLYHYRAIHIRLRHCVPYDDKLAPKVVFIVFIVLIIFAFILKFPIKKNGIKHE